jgi:hypothetical protein
VVNGVVDGRVEVVAGRARVVLDGAFRDGAHRDGAHRDGTPIGPIPMPPLHTDHIAHHPWLPYRREPGLHQLLSYRYHPP